MPPFTAVVVEGDRVSMSRSSARTPFGPLVGLLTCNASTRRRATAQPEKMSATAYGIGSPCSIAPRIVRPEFQSTCD